MDRNKSVRNRPARSALDYIGDGIVCRTPPGPQRVYGFKSRMHISVKQFGPQKGKKRSAKRKNACKLVSKRDDFQITGKRIERLLELRGKMHTLKVLEDFLGRPIFPRSLTEAKAWEKINNEIRINQTPEENLAMELKDVQKDSSLRGQFKVRGIGATNAGRLIKEILFMVANL